MTTDKLVLTTPEAVTYLAGAPAPGTRRSYSVEALLEAARAGQVPVFDWYGPADARKPRFSRHQLDEWARTRSAA